MKLGAVAQFWSERLACTEEVRGSNPLSSTMHCLYLTHGEEEYWVYFDDDGVLKEIAPELKMDGAGRMSFRLGDITVSDTFRKEIEVRIKQYLIKYYVGAAKQALLHI